MIQKNALIVFIKNIIPGKVKTRLAATTGDEKAVKIYSALLQRTREEVLKIHADRYVYYSTFIKNNDDWENDLFIKKVQQGNNIGERMSHAITEVIPHSDKTILIGGDIANITAAIIQEGFEKLDASDFVLGPAHDGGYYLIGMKSPSPSIFENIEWSTHTVTGKTLECISALKKTYHLLPTLSDIDFEEDWIKYGWEIG